ncbi:MAG TPA: protein kinase [Verrucomicrobiales bacterium]|nr:protein kinase [Verrucomicrobiales bacterium]
MARQPLIPDHEIGPLIGAGSYGEVWLARNAIGTPRAVKVIWRDRFESDRPYEREFHGMKKFEPVSRTHAGLVDILQIGRNDEAGHFYYVMELADEAAAEAETSNVKPQTPEETRSLTEPGMSNGEASGPETSLTFDVCKFDASYHPRTLRSEIDHHGRLPFADCLRHFLTLSAGLEALHREGLIHRDIKPSNIIIVGGVAKLADIGLVAEMAESRTFVGTEGFIPPEGPGTAQADIYSLGKVLYEAATGLDRLQYPSLPFGDTPGPAEEGLLELNAVLVKACAPEANQRYQTAARLQGDLALLQSGRSVKRLRVVEGRLHLMARFGWVAVLAAILPLGILGWRVFVDRKMRELSEASELKTKAALYELRIDHAAAQRRSGQMGQRFIALDSLIEAARLGPVTPRLRGEAISALALPDYREEKAWPGGTPELPPQVDGEVQRMARAGKDGGVEIVSLATGSVELSLREEGPPVTWIGPLSADGTKLLTGLADYVNIVWDLSTRQPVLRLPKPPVSAPRAFSPDSREVVEIDGRSLKITALNGGAVRSLPLTFTPKFFRVTPSGKVVLGSREERRVEVVDLADGTSLGIFKVPGAGSFSINLSRDGRLLSVACEDGRVRIWTVAEPSRPPQTIVAHTGVVTVAMFGRDNETLLTSSWDGTTRLFGVGDWKQIASFQSWTGQDLAVSSDGRAMARLNNDDGTLFTGRAAGRTICRVLSMPGREQGGTAVMMSGIAWSPSGEWLAAGTAQGVYLLVPATHSWLGPLPEPQWSGMAFGVNAAGETTLMVASHRGFSRWPLRRTDGGTGPGGDWTIGPPQTEPGFYRFGLSAGGDGGVIAIPTDTGIQLRREGQPPALLPASAFVRQSSVSRDGKFIATSNGNGHTLIWDTATAAIKHDFPTDRMGNVAFSPDSYRCFSAEARDLICRDVESGKEVWRTPLAGALTYPAHLTCSPDGRLVVVRPSSERLALHDAATGALIAPLVAPDPVTQNDFAFTPDSTRLAVTTGAGLIHIWDFRRLREELASLHLDWDHPALPAGEPASTFPLRLRIVEK